jgi:hypothetical protein
MLPPEIEMLLAVMNSLNNSLFAVRLACMPVARRGRGPQPVHPLFGCGSRGTGRELSVK